ncbi:uncharacterized protein PAC_05216 [Phialocephala subalpina]|uniref:PH domain-containing protein n=1 Tax=Phialocephala subalpina TaxID=576137 RepID=A0A1L7WRD5_9HELO|nr:uncharacterized protein PAC_05216 [Phialocephala subalpina]
MSAVEATKPVEEPVVAPTETATEAPAASETAPVETAATEAPAATAPETTETTEAAPVVEEAKPIEEGVLGTKGPGFIKNLFFDKKYFWFGTEPVEAKTLSSYLRGEKNQEAAQKNISWAASTGKGLLFFSKSKAAVKTSPAGVINLSEVSDIIEDGTDKFAFTYDGHKHIFEASTLAERDGWVAALKAKTAEAKDLATTVPESEEYKKAIAEYAPKTPVVAAAVPKEEDKKEEKAEEVKEAKEEKKEEKKEIKEEKKDTRKSRSASRKRTSIFGAIPGFGKKEEKTEAPKEDAVVAPATEEAAAPVEPVVAPETTTTEEAASAEATPASPTEKPAPVKRNSVFATLKGFGKKEKSETEAAPAVPAKDAEPVSETAPVIPAVEASEPLGTDVSSPATVPTETTEAPVTNGETKAEAPTTKSDKRKSSLPFFNKKEKVPATEEEGEKAEKPKSPGFSFSKLRATVKGKSSPKAEKAAEKPAEAEASTETAAATESTPAAPVVSEPEPVVPQSTPQVTASA